MNADHAQLVEMLAEHIAYSGWIKFREMNEFVADRGIAIDVGGQELTGEDVRRAHIWPGTVLLGPTSREYVGIIDALFSTYPINLMIGDVADFNGDEPWWVTWVGPPPERGVCGRTYPPVNPYVHEIADRAKHAYASATQMIAAMQYRLAELAGTSQLDPAESMELQAALVCIWEEVFFGTLCAVRDWTTDDYKWDEWDNTYSDGRQVVHQIRIEPREHSDDCWQHNHRMLGDGAPNEFPLGTISYIAPWHPDHPRDDRQPQSVGVMTLAERLAAHRDPAGGDPFSHIEPSSNDRSLSEGTDGNFGSGGLPDGAGDVDQ